jgi:N-acylglucosamine 2-epimerase
LSINLADQLAFYTHHLKSTLLPFWLQRSVDEEHGGFFTCFDNEGRTLRSRDKFTWSQGRMVWVWAKLASMEIFSAAERTRYLHLARSGATFLMQHCLLPGDRGAGDRGTGDRCAFLMTREGEPKPQAEGMPFDSSIYADCFVILGLARYAAVSRDRAVLDFAHRLYRSVNERIRTGDFRTEPYPIPIGYKAHGIPMILLNTSQEMAAGLEALGMPEDAFAANQIGDLCLHEIITHFVCPDGVVHEMINSWNECIPASVLGRYINPGHTIEDMWFVMHQARRSHVPGTSEVPGTSNAMILKAAQVIKRTFQMGWDQEFGGLLLFADQDGGPPRGSLAGIENERMAQKVLADWGSKLWWVHSEALYTTLLAWRLTGDDEFLELYRQVFDYTFRTFPNPDPEIGEWIQIRDRQGRPEQRVVALPVKDPFHIIRNMAQIIELLAIEPLAE